MVGASRAGRLVLAGILTDRRERRKLPVPTTRRGLRRLDPRIRQPIFVLGAPRSGTSFLGRCIAALPDVSYHFEPRLTKALARDVYEGRRPVDRAGRYFRGYYGTLLLLAGHGGLSFAEKDPENCFIVPFLAATFPDAVFVHVIRDGRDVAVSHAAKPWLAATSAGLRRRGRSGNAWGPHPRFWVEPHRHEEFSTVSDLARSAWMWRRFTSSALDHLAALAPGRFLEVRYEEMVRAPAQAAERMADFLPNRGDAARDALRSAFGQARSDSVGRWRTALTRPQLVDIDRHAGELLERLGYAGMSRTTVAQVAPVPGPAD